MYANGIDSSIVIYNNNGVWYRSSDGEGDVDIIKTRDYVENNNNNSNIEENDTDISYNDIDEYDEDNYYKIVNIITITTDHAIIYYQ